MTSIIWSDIVHHGRLCVSCGCGPGGGGSVCLGIYLLLYSHLLPPPLFFSLSISSPFPNMSYREWTPRYLHECCATNKNKSLEKLKISSSKDFVWRIVSQSLLHFFRNKNRHCGKCYTMLWRASAKQRHNTPRMTTIYTRALSIAQIRQH